MKSEETELGGNKMPWGLLESIIETLEVLGDPELLEALRHGIREAEEGKGIPWEEAKKTLGL